MAAWEWGGISGSAFPAKGQTVPSVTRGQCCTWPPVTSLVGVSVWRMLMHRRTHTTMYVHTCVHTCTQVVPTCMHVYVHTCGSKINVSLPPHISSF